MLFELVAVLIPWILVAIAVPVLLYIVPAVFNLVKLVADRIQAARDRKMFSAYARRGFY